MNVFEAIDRCPYLASPAALAIVDSGGRWTPRPHLSAMNRELMDVGFGKTERLGIHIPFQHGKTLLASQYFSAWLLLLFPWMRIILGSHSERYSGSIGGKVRDIIDRFGGPLGVKLKQDSKSKNEWNIDSHGGFDGGMVCKGYTGGINGRACDLLLLDDVLKNTAQALSPVILDAQWEWYQVTAYSRLGPTAPIVMVTTRWVKNDLPGRIYAEAKDTGENWRVVKFKAIAGENDPLGRKPGEALWPERVPLARLELIKKKRGRWFWACWQQEPQEEEGLHFRPRRTKDSDGWPVYHNLGDAWSLPCGITRDIFLHSQCPIIIGIDWAMGKKKTSDMSAMIVACLTPDGRLLIVDVVNARIRYEDNARRLAEVCRKYGRQSDGRLFGNKPMIVVGDDDMLSEALVVECRRHDDIPEIRRLPISGANKVNRAMAAIIRGENGLIYLPADKPEKPPWLDEFCDQLAAFTGADGEEDDMVDALGVIGRIADSLKPPVRASRSMPEMLLGGRIPR